MTIAILTFAGLAATVAVVYWVWPDKAVMNVIRAARRKKALRSLQELSVAQLTRRAHAGDGAAQYKLGNMHATGDGVLLDYSRANYWFERASRAGFTEAIYCLALHYEHGRGTDADERMAFKLYEKAAHAGSADARCNLGMMYLRGKGTESSRVAAVSWFVLAKAQGHDRAAQNLELLLGNDQDLTADELSDLRRIEARAARRDSDAMLTLGWMYAAGFVKRKDLDAAAAYYKRAQEAGHVFAHVLLAELTGVSEAPGDD